VAPSDARFTALALAIALVLVVCSFANGIDGKFVYDDEKQIATNPLIQDARLLGKALTSDVWAFTGDEGKAQSNYWRPIFVFCLSVQYRLFGANTTPWHVANILLHLLATTLGYFVLRAVGTEPEGAAVGTWIFAAHPVHVESITWISGSPDPMVASFLFGAYLCYLSARSRGSVARAVGGPVLFAGALLCKEIAIVFPGIVFLTELASADGARLSLAQRSRAAVRACAPYVAVALIYVTVRVGVIGMRHIVSQGQLGLAGVALSAPEVLVFYVRHAIWPFGLGPTYPLRPVSPANLGLGNFVIPSLVVAATALCAYALARRGRIYALGLVWFFLPLAPVFDVRSFIPEDFVHDRYVYLPLFGIAMIAGGAVTTLWARARRPGRAADRSAAWALGIPIAVVLMLLTRAYNAAWLDNIALWESGVRSNPDSAFPHAQLAEAYRKANRLPDARREAERALQLNPVMTNAHVVLGAVALKENSLDEAQQHLELVLSQYPEFGPALDQLALTFQKQGKIEPAIEIFERARRATPLRHALYTVNIAVLHRMANRSDEALADLVSIRDQLERATDPIVLRGFWYLGELYREKGSRDQAIAAYRSYLAATEGSSDPEVVALRKIVADTLQTTAASSGGS
jgi:cytochrome c-type biogenesis protein CcmH/NrfG